ncbi:hypothetical protein [Streptosporangium sp. NPDC087985]|uniref:hypothetical protein n=1 Tax=Streptosporangium sp. NPDC087985 TaxID=3366196 RepID=UPI0037F39651
MRAIPGWLLRKAGQDVTVEPFIGEGPFGPTFGAEVVVRCLVEHKRRLVRDSSGSEVISETTLRMQLTETCPAGSRVTLPDGRPSTVLSSAPIDGGRLPVPSHLQVTLQ